MDNLLGWELLGPPTELCPPPAHMHPKMQLEWFGEGEIDLASEGLGCLALLLTSCVTFEMFLNLSEPWFSLSKMQIIRTTLLISMGCCKDAV